MQGSCWMSVSKVKESTKQISPHIDQYCYLLSWNIFPSPEDKKFWIVRKNKFQKCSTKLTIMWKNTRNPFSKTACFREISFSLWGVAFFVNFFVGHWWGGGVDITKLSIKIKLVYQTSYKCVWFPTSAFNNKKFDSKKAELP